MKHLHIFRGNRNTNTFCVSTLYHINSMLSSIILTYTIYFLIASLLLPLSLEKADALLDQAQTAHLCIYAGETLEGAALDECRASRIRELLMLPEDNLL